MNIISMRLTGPTASIDAMLDALRASDGVDHVVEMGAVEAPRTPDDSSSAGLSDATAGGDARDVEVHTVSEAVMRAARVHADMAARDAGVMVEWLDPL